MEFCKQYNAATENQRGTIVPVEITIYEDRSFTLRAQDPADAGAHPRGRRPRQGRGGCRAASRSGTITDAQLAEIAKVKLPDLNTDDIEAAKRQVAGTARSMGIAVAG